MVQVWSTELVAGNLARMILHKDSEKAKGNTHLDFEALDKNIKRQVWTIHRMTSDAELLAEIAVYQTALAEMKPDDWRRYQEVSSADYTGRITKTIEVLRMALEWKEIERKDPDLSKLREVLEELARVAIKVRDSMYTEGKNLDLREVQKLFFEARRLRSPPLHPDPNNRTDGDVHTAHCCAVHGCKYGDGQFCTVEQDEKLQSYKCEECGLEEEGYYDD